MQDTRCPKEPHAQRSWELAPSAVTASAVGGSANRSVVGRVSPTTSAASNAAQSPCARHFLWGTFLLKPLIGLKLDLLDLISPNLT